MIKAGPRLTAIGSGKGGTGKTFVTIGLAHALAAMGEHVLVCDADLGLSNTTIHLGLAQGGDLEGMLAGRARLIDAVVHVPNAGFDLLAAPTGSGALADADAHVAQRLVAIFRRAISYDRILIDLGAGVSELVMTFAAEADDMLVIATPDPSSITDAYAFLKRALWRSGGRMPSLAVNLAASAAEARRTAESLQNAAKTFLRATPGYLGYIPLDPRVTDSVRRQAPLSTLHPQSPAVASLAALAAALGGPTGRISAASSVR
ncbi:MAG: P-loop NTPase [Alphaproteobacteria bacterium]|nr:P-loop NTPase [Alphaproteobacteria bacterium]